MNRDVKNVTIVTQTGTKSYSVGEYLNYRKIHHIIQRYEGVSEDYFVYIQGYDEDENVLFELINVPVDIEYLVAD